MSVGKKMERKRKRKCPVCRFRNRVISKNGKPKRTCGHKKCVLAFESIYMIAWRDYDAKTGSYYRRNKKKRLKYQHKYLERKENGGK